MKLLGSRHLDLKTMSEKYHKNNKKPIPFDFKWSSKELMDGINGNNKCMHNIHYYPGRIFPYIPAFLLSIDEFDSYDGYVLDPFAGSSTILLESIINPIMKRNAYGIEINPLARLISKVKTTPIETNKIDELMKGVEKIYVEKGNSNEFIPDFKNFYFWFSKKGLKKLSKLRYSIEMLDTSPDYKDFFWVCFTNIVRKVSRANPYIPPPVLLKPEKYKNNQFQYDKLKKFLRNSENPDVWKCFENTVATNKNKITHLNSYEEVKNREVKASIIWDDVRDMKKGRLKNCGRINKNNAQNLSSNSIDLVFTSPPYLTAQKYIRTSKLELFWLGYTEKEVFEYDKSSIGSERTYIENEIHELGLKTIDNLINKTYSKDKTRGKMVFNYFNNMIISLKEIYRVVRGDGYFILVVGKNKVLGENIDTYKLLIDAAEQKGFTEIITFKDKIRTRSMMTKRNGTGGLIKNEYISILNKGN